jgi:flagella basal body P-ring formation protein FlgA
MTDKKVTPTDPSPVHFGLALALIVLVLAIASSAFGAVVALTPRDAIERAILERMGGNVTVLVTMVRADVVAEPSLRAVPDPAARAGQPTRFVLTVNGIRKGSAVATVEVQGSYARAAQPIARDTLLTDADVEVVDGELPNVAFKRLPAAGDVIGLRARRAIAAGEALTAMVLDVPPLVKSGDEVTATVRIGAVQIDALTTASGSGQAGDIIRVLAPGSRKPLKARITGQGAVEVVR